MTVCKLVFGDVHSVASIRLIESEPIIPATPERLRPSPRHHPRYRDRETAGD